MKKKLFLSILGMNMAAASSYGQGYTWLDSYFSFGPQVTYGANVPRNGISGTLGTVGAGLYGGVPPTSWTVGLYFVVGTPNITDPAGNGMPDPQLVLGTGPGSSAIFFFEPGRFNPSPSQPFNVSASGTPTITAEIVAYESAASSYATAAYRGHSDPFTMPSGASDAVIQFFVGSYMTGFSVTPVPEPTTLVLAGLGGLSLLLFRRKKA